ncbi:hypothetical protein AB0J86_29705 [Micromonospora sp. NPDC049559]|uniref:hypothetical protein n=1 Tax=Micromonospora sp. NPDC049559 TaxID=3155923 RepID=UPI00343A1A7D
MLVPDQLAIIDGLLALPFPDRGLREGNLVSGSGFHLRVLAASRDFWDDRGTEVVEEAQAAVDAAFGAVAAALSARWGDPETVDLAPYLWGADPAPEPMGWLCQLGGAMDVWRPPGVRWVALAVGQADPEFPIELLAAVAETPIRPGGRG